VCVCVCEREREREKEKETENSMILQPSECAVPIVSLFYSVFVQLWAHAGGAVLIGAKVYVVVIPLCMWHTQTY
jgi:hypothetical protein